jgi:hypothetical protein
MIVPCADVSIKMDKFDRFRGLLCAGDPDQVEASWRGKAGQAGLSS